MVGFQEYCESLKAIYFLHMYVHFDKKFFMFVFQFCHRTQNIWHWIEHKKAENDEEKSYTNIQKRNRYEVFTTIENPKRVYLYIV